MFDIDGTLVSLDLVERFFCCDLDSCLGACCIEGDSGAPLTREEYEQLKAVLPEVWDDLLPQAQQQITENGVAYIYIDRAMQEEFNLTLEQASACVGTLDSIRGCICWIAFIENGDAENSIRVRLRSRFVTINGVAEKHHGGGHACASGATVYSQEEFQELLAEADEVVREYKATHDDWL
jgi:nanoRNase/pAp phosphatase (c-di-AMP/oligoRNAs hydrolase)